MKALTTLLSQAVLLALLGAIPLFGGCKDDDPCDAGETERYGQCYPVPQAGGGSAGSGSSGLAGAEMGGRDEGQAGADAAPVDTPFGTECQDDKDSSDCGGAAPVCADLSPLGQSRYCTQINCSEGEANAGVCPEGFTCFAVSGYPSICIKG